MNGIVKKKMEGKNFGFITPEEGDKDMFFHANELVDVTFDEIQEGDNVTFDVVDGEKGPAATNVKKAQAAVTDEAAAVTDEAA